MSATTLAATARRTRQSKPRVLSRLRPPEDMSLEQWQTELRRQFGREQKFRIENLGEHPVYSCFRVTNPQTGGSYQVRIRGEAVGENACTCPDFATNSLGTCKHIECVLGKITRRREWNALLRGGRRPAPVASEIILKYGASRRVMFRAGAECPPGLARLASRYFDRDAALRAEKVTELDEFLRKAARFGHEVVTADDALAFVAELRDAERRRREIEEAFPRGIRSAEFKRLVTADLYDYQREGALFAARSGRCIIADEMGLGKTVQAIAAAEIMARRLGVSRVLVVCPTSLKHQWEREIRRFTDRDVRVVGGPPAQRRALYETEAFFKVVNYDRVHRDLAAIGAWSPDLVILDEAQRIKNWNTRTARSVKKLSSPYAIVLTGTPLENRLEELVSIVEFVDLHRLGPTFKFLGRHQARDEHGRVVGYRDLEAIGRTLAPILIRRRKADVALQLPGRIDKHFFVPMTPEQMTLHEENRELVARIVFRWRRHHFLSEADQRRLMVALQNMRMSCDSTYLLDQNTDHGTKADEFATLVGELCEQPATKIVVFSQWVRMHELLQRRLRSRRIGYTFFHGGVEGDKRGELIARFRTDEACRVFLSTDAGGVGLNLQHANVVINMDMPWNPAVLEQRIGRVHRLGQTQPVQVFNYVSQGSIEEGMLSLLSFKKSLFTGVLDGGSSEVFLGGSRLTKFMETVEKATEAIPARDASAEEDAADAAEAAAGGGPDEAGTRDGEHRSDSHSSGGSNGMVTPREPGPERTGRGAESMTEALHGLIEAGVSYLTDLAGAAKALDSGQAAGARATGPAAGAARLPMLRRDPASGEPYLHLPVPSKQELDRVLAAVGELATWLRAR